jgi:hypothetical protein
VTRSDDADRVDTSPMTRHQSSDTARRPARRTTFTRAAVAALALAGAVAGTACSDSDGDVGGENSGASGSEFCADFEALNNSLATSDSADFDTIVDGLESLDPPQQIADDFDTMVEAARQLADLDPSDPAQVEDAQALQEDSQDAQQNVSSYIEDECGLDLSTSGGVEGSTEPDTTTPSG